MKDFRKRANFPLKNANRFYYDVCYTICWLEMMKELQAPILEGWVSIERCPRRFKFELHESQ